MSMLSNFTNITAAGYTSPYTPSIISYGVLDPKHTTTAQATYNHQTVLTPWPYITADFGLSFVLAMWTLLASFRSPNYNANKSMVKTTIVDIVLVLIATIRCLTLCVSAIQAISGHGGRFRACTAIIVAWMSMSTFEDGSSKEYILSQIMRVNSWLMTVMMQIMIWPAIVPRNAPHDHRYGQLFVTGGNCAFAVRDCREQSFYKVGCGLDNPANDTRYWHITPYNFNDEGKYSSRYNIVSNIEPFLGGLTTAFGAICLYPLYKVVCVHWRYRGMGRDTDYWGGYDDDDKRGRRRSAISRMIVLLIFGGISIGLHYIQQVQPGSLSIVDSYGPLADKDTAGESWSDCFVVPIVRDQLGFFHAWWDAIRPYPADWLSVT